MRKIFRNRLVIGIACIAAAGILCISIFGMAKSRQEEVTVIKVATDLKMGTVIEDTNLDVVKMFRNDNLSGFATEKSEVVGKYATSDMLAGELLLNSKTADNFTVDSDVLQEIPDGMVAIAIESSTDYNSLANKIVAGDIVSLIVNVDTVSGSGKSIFPELTYVPVISVATDAGVEQTGDQLGVKTVTTTVMVTPQQATIISAHNGDPIHMVLVSRGDESKAEKLLELQAKQLSGEKVIEGTSYLTESFAKESDDETKKNESTKSVK